MSEWRAKWSHARSQNVFVAFKHHSCCKHLKLRRWVVKEAKLARLRTVSEMGLRKCNCLFLLMILDCVWCVLRRMGGGGGNNWLLWKAKQPRFLFSLLIFSFSYSPLIYPHTKLSSRFIVSLVYRVSGFCEIASDRSRLWVTTLASSFQIFSPYTLSMNRSSDKITHTLVLSSRNILGYAR